MNKHKWLVEQFEANRTHLQAVAYRMLGELGEADDAVQESWLRLSRSETSGVPRVAQRDGLSRELALSLTLTRGHLIGLQPRESRCKQPDEA
jgi:hypothetical protein